MKLTEGMHLKTEFGTIVFNNIGDCNAIKRKGGKIKAFHKKPKPKHLKVKPWQSPYGV